MTPQERSFIKAFNKGLETNSILPLKTVINYICSSPALVCKWRLVLLRCASLKDGDESGLNETILETLQTTKMPRSFPFWDRVLWALAFVKNSRFSQWLIIKFFTLLLKKKAHFKIPRNLPLKFFTSYVESWIYLIWSNALRDQEFTKKFVDIWDGYTQYVAFTVIGKKSIEVIPLEFLCFMGFFFEKSSYLQYIYLLEKDSYVDYYFSLWGTNKNIQPKNIFPNSKTYIHAKDKGLFILKWGGKLNSSPGLLFISRYKFNLKIIEKFGLAIKAPFFFIKHKKLDDSLVVTAKAWGLFKVTCVFNFNNYAVISYRSAAIIIPYGDSKKIKN